MGAVEFFNLLRLWNLYLHVYSLFKDLLQDLKLNKGEFTLSKDTPVSLWTEYRTWFGCKKYLGGDFVIVSDDLYDEFETFKKKLYSYVDRAFSIVKAVELIDVRCTSYGGVTLKPLHLLESVYYLMHISNRLNHFEASTLSNAPNSEEMQL